MAETESNMEAVRGGFAIVKQAMHSTRCYHAIHNGRGRMYLCGCCRPIRGVEEFPRHRLGRAKRKDWRFGDDFRYGKKAPALRKGSE